MSTTSAFASTEAQDYFTAPVVKKTRSKKVSETKVQTSNLHDSAQAAIRFQLNKFARINNNGVLSNSDTSSINSLVRWWQNKPSTLPSFEFGSSTVLPSVKTKNKVVHGCDDIAIARWYFGDGTYIIMMISGKIDNVISYVYNHTFMVYNQEGNSAVQYSFKTAGIKKETFIAALLANSYNIFSIRGSYASSTSGSIYEPEGWQTSAPVLVRVLGDAGLGELSFQDIVVWLNQQPAWQVQLQELNTKYGNPVSTTRYIPYDAATLELLVRKYIECSKYLKNKNVCQYYYLKDSNYTNETHFASAKRTSEKETALQIVQRYIDDFDKNKSENAGKIPVISISAKRRTITYINSAASANIFAIDQNKICVKMNINGKEVYIASQVSSLLIAFIKEIDSNYNTAELELAFVQMKTKSKSKVSPAVFGGEYQSVATSSQQNLPPFQAAQSSGTANLPGLGDIPLGAGGISKVGSPRSFSSSAAAPAASEEDTF